MELLLLLKCDNSSPYVTRDKDILSHDYELMISLPPKAKYPMEPFQLCLPATQI